MKNNIQESFNDLFTEFINISDKDPISIYELARKTLCRISQTHNCIANISILSHEGHVVLPILSLPSEKGKNDVPSELITIASIGLNLKKKITNNKESKTDYIIPDDSWLINILLKEKKTLFFEVTNSSHDEKFIEENKGERTMLYKYKYKDSSNYKNNEAELIVPKLLSKRSKLTNYLQKFYAFAFKLPYQSMSAELILLFTFSPIKENIRGIDNLGLELFSLETSNYITLGYTIADIIRSQTSSSNSKYITRYFKIKLAIECFKKLENESDFQPEVQQFIISILVSNTDHVVARHLLRYLFENKSKHKDIYKLLEKIKLTNWNSLYLEQLPQIINKSQQYKKIDGDKRTILINSPRGGVGKTTVGLALANYIGKYKNKKVCFIENDIVSPTIYYMWDNIQNNSDSWEELFKINANLDEKDSFKFEDIKKHIIHYNTFDILPAYPPKNKSTKLSQLYRANLTGTLKDIGSKLINTLKSKYDWIIIDTPAGLRELGDPSELKIDTCLIFSYVNKVNLLNVERTLKEFNKTRNIVILNKSQKIDSYLFGSKLGMYDFIFDSKFNKHSWLAIERSLMRNILDNCDFVYPFGAYAEFDRIDELDDIFVDVCNNDLEIIYEKL